MAELGSHRWNLHHSPRSWARRAIAGAVACGVVIFAPVSSSTPGSAAQAQSDFYTPPAVITGRAGDVIKHQPMTVQSLPGIPMLGVTSTRIMYVSVNREGRKVPVTGTVIEPTSPWSGPGARPLIAFAQGTHGVGDACAPSHLLARGTQVEGNLQQLQAMAARGYAVAITDYIGVGPASVRPSYIHRLEQGRAVLDAARAATRLRHSAIPATAPIFTYGFSQGGEGSGAALEMQPTYAPGMRLKGGYAGAIPDEFPGVVGSLDGSAWAGFMGNFMNGINSTYPNVRFTTLLTDAGKRFMAQTANECVPGVLAAHVLVRSSGFFKDGKSFADHLRRYPLLGVERSARLGRFAVPNVPVLVGTSTADDIVPYAVTRRVAQRWCAGGVRAQFVSTPIPTHAGSLPVLGHTALSWIDDRVHGRPLHVNCGEF